MSEAERSARLAPDHQVTVDDVRELAGASAPHFALQIRNRLLRLVSSLPGDDPARVEAEREIARLERLAVEGEQRAPALERERPLPSLTEADDGFG